MHDLTNIALFSGLSAAEQEAISAVMTPVALPERTLVFEEGDLSESLYLLVSGSVDVFISNAAGERFTLAKLERGNYFGELAFLDHEARSASVLTLEDCQFLILDKDTFAEILSSYPHVYTTLVSHLVGMVRGQTATIRQLAMNDSYNSLRLFLNGRQSEMSSFRKGPPKLSPAFIADNIDTSQEIVVRLLDQLERQKILSVNEGAIFVHKLLPEKL